ncbi:hypothetical protein GCM10027415_01080 [Humibacter ginsengisoli]
MIKDAIDHAILAPAGGVKRRKGLTQRLAEPARVLAQCSHDELERGGRDFLWQVLFKSSSGDSRKDDLARPVTSYAYRCRAASTIPIGMLTSSTATTIP